MKNITYKGEWFLPSDKEKRINGILTFDSDEGSSLELFGNFEGNILGSFQNQPIILGLSNDSKEITLYDCFVSSTGGATLRMRGESGTPSTIYTIKFILEGIHVDTIEDVKFNRLTAEILYLDEWLGVSGFTPQNDPLEDFVKNMSEKKYEINIQYKLPDPINFDINETLKGLFNFVINVPGLTLFQKSVHLNQRAQFILTSTTEYTVEEFLSHLFSFQNFLVLALYHRTYPTDILLRSERFKDGLENEEKPIYKKIRLFFPILNQFESAKSKSDISMLFAYDHIKEEFPIIIQSWYKNHDKLEPAFDLVFEQFYNNERFTVNTFLNLAQAAETFHARTNNHTKIPRDEYQKMKEKLIEIAPKEYRGWLKDQFNFGNNLNLHARLTEIVDKYSDTMLDKMIGDKEKFVKEVKWSRNYYTHYSTDGETHALKGQDLFYLAERLKILLVSAFLIEVGFNKDKLDPLLDRNKHRFFHQLIRL